MHTVTISPDTAEAGAELSPVGFILSESLDHSEASRPGLLYGRWRRVLKRLDLDGSGLQFKGLRHLTASALLASGMDPVRVADRLGHSVEVLLSTYAHVLPDKDDEAAGIMGELLRQEG